MQKAVGDLIQGKYNFFVPDYQRGYRWGDNQIFALLDDLLEFYRKTKQNTLNYQYYSLQPLVVKKSNEIYTIIDGQQRLTTIYLILSAFEQYAQTRTKPKIKITYSRDGSENFLTNIQNSDYIEKIEGNNIDFTYMSKAYGYIFDWITKEKHDEDYIEAFMNFIRTSSDLKDSKDIATNIRFIWYVLPENEDEFDTFIRLNIGKIPLTNAELIKSFIIQKIDSKEKRFEVSQEWDDIEYSLNNDDFFGFLTKDSFHTRIELLFKILLNQKNYKEFELYNNFIEKYDEKENILHIWNEIKDMFHTIQFWFEDREFYHLIGYLIATDDNIIDIWKGYNDETSSSRESFKQIITSKIKNKLYIKVMNNDILFELKGKEIYLEKLEYMSDNISNNYNIYKLLLLVNILTLLNSSKDSYMKFSFNLFNSQKWSIEHINPQTDQLSQSIKSEKFREDLKSLNNDDVNNVLKEIKESTTDYDDVISKLENIFNDQDIREDNDNIKNLALLSSSVNSSLKNNFFPVKRKILIDKDKMGYFIPICTKNLFLKYYSDFSKEDCTMLKWTDSDGDSYISEMKKLLIEFLKEKKI